MEETNELRLRSGRIIRRPTPYIPHQNLLQRQQVELERRRRSAVLPQENARPSTSGVFYSFNISPEFDEDRMTVLEIFTTETVVQQVDVNEETSCRICLEKFVLGEKLRVLQCEHSFHLSCIDLWFRHSLNCPICRHVVGSSRPLLHDSRFRQVSSSQMSFNDVSFEDILLNHVALFLIRRIRSGFR